MTRLDAKGEGVAMILYAANAGRQREALEKRSCGDAPVLFGNLEAEDDALFGAPRRFCHTTDSSASLRPEALWQTSRQVRQLSLEHCSVVSGLVAWHQAGTCSPLLEFHDCGPHKLPNSEEGL